MAWRELEKRRGRKNQGRSEAVVELRLGERQGEIDPSGTRMFSTYFHLVLKGLYAVLVDKHNGWPSAYT